MKQKQIIIVLAFFVFILIFSEKAYSQCAGGGIYAGNLNMLPTFQTESVSAGQRYTFSGYENITYIFSFCQGGGSNSIDTQIEICDQNGTVVQAYNDDHCGLGSELTWTCTSNATYSIVIYQYNCNASGANAGTLAYRTITPPNEQDCLGAIPLCFNTYNTTASYSGDGNYNGEIPAYGGSMADNNCPGNCLLGGEVNDVWYTFTAQTSGTVSFIITPNNSADDYDWAVYDLTNADCMDIASSADALQVSCNFCGTSGSTGPSGASALDCQHGNSCSNFNDDLDVVAGETYVVNVSNWSSTQSGYTISFGGSAQIIDNTGPHIESILYAPECGSSSLTIQFSERLWCTSVQPDDFIITGPEGNYDVADAWSEICEAGLGSTYADTYYDDVWTLELSDYLEHDGNYNLTVVAGGVDDICSNFSPQNSVPFTIDGIDADTLHTDCSCFGANDGTVQVSNIVGATPPYTINWTGPSGFTSTAQNLNGLSPGAYNVTIGDATGRCEFVSTLIVTEPSQISFNTSVIQPVCGDSNGSIAVGGISGSFSPYDIACTGQATVFNTTSHTFTGLSDGTYTITVTGDHGCTTTSIVVLSSADNPDATFVYNGNQCYNNQSFNFNHTGVNVPGETYAWVFSGGNPASSSDQNPTGVTFTSEGVHNVSLTVTAGACTDSYNLNVTAYPLPLPSVNVSNENCGNCDGVAIAGVGFSSYQWSSSGNSSNTETGLCAGSYAITVQDANGCSNTENFSIANSGIVPIANVVTTDPSCFGDCDATATVNATGPATFSYVYSSGVTPNNQMTGGLCSGIYSVTVADATNSSCNVVEGFTISDPSEMVLTMNSSDASCGLSNGVASVSVVGGVLPLDYDWSNGGVLNTISNVVAGNYFVTVTDASGCTATNSIAINDAGAPFTISASVDQDALCFGGCDGQASVVAIGVGPFDYQWSSGINPLNASVGGLCSGLHTVSVSEGACTLTETVVVGEPSLISATVSSLDAHCGQSDGSISVIASGGTIASDYSYEWDCVPAQFSATANGLPAGTYHVTVVDDNSCTAEFTGSIMDVGGVAINQIHTSTQCSYSSDGSATISVLSGDPDFTYSWSHGVNYTTSVMSHSLTNLAAQNYIVTVTDVFGCSAVSSFTINSAPVINLTINNHEDVSCNGLCDGSVSASADGGTGVFVYDWGAGNGLTPDMADNVGLCSGNYVLTVTDNNSCSSIASIVIDEPDPMTLILSNTSSHCSLSDGTASVVASGGLAPYTYLWSGGTQSMSANNTGLSSAGSPYSVQVTDANGCVETGTVVISDEPAAAISISSVTDVSCFGFDDGTAQVSIGGGSPPFAIEWGTIPVQNTNLATNLTPGQHDVSVTDMYGCLYVASTIINEPAVLSVSTTAPVIDCFGICNGSALASATGGNAPYNYLWNDFQNSQMAVGLCAGDYEVTVTDDNLCTASDVITITENDQILLSAVIVNSDCGQSNGSIDLIISGGAAGAMIIDWDYGPHTEDLLNIPAGTYTVTVTDNKGCQSIQNFAVNDVSGPTVSVASVSNTTCNGSCDGQATIDVVGGSGWFDYQWNTLPVQTNPTVTNLCAGTYSVVVTDMNTGCITNSSVTIDEPGQLDVGAVIVSPHCHNACDGEIQLTTFDGTPPYSFAWAGPGDLPDSEDVVSLCAGNYTLVVSDVNNCFITRDYTLINPSPVSASTVVHMTNCGESCDGDALVIPSGGMPPYSFVWSDPNSQSGQNAVNLCAGLYGVTVSDDNGCSGSAMANVPNPSSLVFGAVSKSNPSCFGSLDGSINIVVSGGTPPYYYSWDNGSSSAMSSNLPDGVHCVTVQDNNGCLIDTCFELNQPEELVVNMITSDESCNSYCDGEIEAVVSGGNLPFIFSWSNGAVSAFNNNLCSGMYILTVTDNNGCQIVESTSLNGPGLLDVIVQDTVMPHCGNSDGAITVGVLGGTFPYEYEWESLPTENSAVVNDLPNGNYTVSVTDANGCMSVEIVDLNDITAPVIDSVVVLNVDCHGNATGEAIVYFTSSTASNSIQWNDMSMQTSAHAINLTEGNYTVSIVDANGCQTSQTIAVTEPEVFRANVVSHQDVSCFGFCNGTAEASFIGGTEPVNFSWTGGYSGSVISGLCPGVYTLNAVDGNGCISSENVVVEEPSVMVLSENVYPVTCYGGSDGSVSVGVSGGSGNYDYEWFGSPSTEPVASGLSSANYALVVYNANDHSCFVTENYFVPEPDEILATLATVNATCNADNGSMYIQNVTGGTPTYLYSWLPGNYYGVDSVAGLAPGNYECFVTDAYGCSASFPVNVGETQAPNLDNVHCSPVSCYGYSDGNAIINVSDGTVPYAYDWNPNVSDCDFCDTLSAGVYIVTVTDANGCNVFATVPITGPSEVVAFVDPADTICIGQSAQISANASGGEMPYLYSWTIVGEGSTHWVSPEQTIVYELVAEDVNGCSSEVESVQIVVNPPLELIVTTPESVCFGQTALLNAIASGGDGNYMFNWGSGIVSNNPCLSFNPEINTSFEVVLSDGCGTPCDTSLVGVTVAPQPEVNIVKTPSNGCAPLMVKFDNNSMDNASDYQWYFDDDNSGDNNYSQIKNPSHYYENSGYYQVALVVETNQGCRDSGVVNVTVKEPPKADFIAQPWTSGMLTGSIHFNDESIGATAWKWHFGDQAMSTLQNPDYSFNEAGEIPVKLIAYNNIGCTDTIIQNVRIIEEHRFYVPDAINVRSPGNDQFYPKGVGIELDSYYMIIYNRWGEPVFETDDIDEHWKGRSDNNRGDYVQQGIYTWVITLRDKFGKDHTYSGQVMVFK